MTLTREVLRMAREAGINVYDASEFGEDSMVIIGNSGISLNSLRKLIQLGIAEGEKLERERLWNLIDSNINKDGNLSGYGSDQLAQNNGLVLACNLIMNEIRDKGSKDCED